MEQVRKFLTNMKQTAIVGLIGSIVLFFIQYISVRPFNILTRVAFLLSYLGLIVYFIIIVMRIFLKKGNVKLANNFLIASFVISIVFKILLFYLSRFFTGIGTNIPILDILLLLYFISILYKRNVFINNKIFALILIVFCIYSILDCISVFGYVSILQVVRCISYLMIVPYFYNYYNLIKRGIKNDK